MIVVTGAGGHLGGLVVSELLARTTADQVAVTARNPDKLAHLAERGVRVRHGDFADPDGLAHAFEGATQVLVVSTDTLGEQALGLHRAAIEAAAAAGAQRVLYTSHMGARPDSPFPPAPDHWATEAVLGGTGTAHTALRNGFYASTAVRLLVDALRTGELRVPEDGPVAWTTHADLAQGTARILLDGGFDGPTPPLTGPETVDMARLAALATDITGTTVRHVVVPDEEYRASYPAPVGELMLTLFVAARAGDFGPADPTLATLLDRPATTVEDHLRAELAKAPAAAG
ncbi:NAD(P)H-binding protein [Actinokineospora bangkokensis]|uniref:NAD(P)-dependent oxidoreductase n=1 Tax=Actinokineospora bangkokensis TaxID=1193682 RepID=A0A1Q9LK29_9PSEU|nr:NAD(P)H-binding protein [Actinokineospora bangkokensis]OLR92407.1 NAD(P)-dependent oxidoreductase [Actinokineospora bangkokensis]